MEPFAKFNFEQPRDTIAEVMESLEKQVPEVVRAFRTRQPIIGSVKVHQAKKLQLEEGIHEVLARQEASEAIGIQEGEFSIITGETFFPEWFADLLCSLASECKIRTACPWTVGALWGYSSADDMLDEDSDCRLSLINAQLLPRSGRQFLHILELVRSQTFEQDLVIVNEDDSEELTSSLENMRLRTKSASLHCKKLSEHVCFSLQAFIRLQAKLKWSTRDLDAAVFLLKSCETGGISPIPTPGSSLVCPTSPYVVKEIASILQLRDLTGLPESSLLPLWGPLDTHGENSFFRRAFLSSSYPSMFVFRDLLDGVTTPIRTHDIAICHVLNWRLDCFVDLLEAVKLHALGEILDIQRLSILYRHALICRILGVSQKSCQHFFQLFHAQSGTPLNSPTSTLLTIREWKRLFEAGWKLETIYSLFRSSDESNLSFDINNKTDEQTQATLRLKSQSLRNEFPLLFKY